MFCAADGDNDEVESAVGTLFVVFNTIFAFALIFVYVFDEKNMKVMITPLTPEQAAEEKKNGNSRSARNALRKRRDRGPVVLGKENEFVRETQPLLPEVPSERAVRTKNEERSDDLARSSLRSSLGSLARCYRSNI